MRKLVVLVIVLFMTFESKSQVLLDIGAGVINNSESLKVVNLGYLFKGFAGVRLAKKYDFGLEHSQIFIYDDSKTSVAYLNFKSRMFFSNVDKMHRQLNLNYLFFVNIGAGLYTISKSNDNRFGKEKDDLFGFNVGVGYINERISYCLDFHSAGVTFEEGKGIRFVTVSLTYSFEFFSEKYEYITTNYDCQ